MGSILYDSGESCYVRYACGGGSATDCSGAGDQCNIASCVT